jgi:hypothetical protein
MNAKVPAAVASAAIVLYCFPVASNASRLPSRLSEPPSQIFVGDSDPWVPDNRQPARMLQAPPFTSAPAPDVDRPSDPPAVAHRTWYARLLRLLRVLGLGGFLR